MKNIRILTILFAACLAIAGCVPQHPTQKNEYDVTQAVDGDTIQLHTGKKVRYVGIDTPEIRHYRGGVWQYSPERYALDALDYNKAMVVGERVRLEFGTEKEDRYGRWLAYVYVGERMINAELLKQGYATIYAFRAQVKHLDVLMDAQAEAMENEKGLWSDYESIPVSDAYKNVGKFAAVRGEVLAVQRTRNGVVLIFEGGFKINILTPILAAFERKGIIPSRYYRGRTVEVVGKIREYDGPNIVVGHPLQITVL